MAGATTLAICCSSSRMQRLQQLPNGKFFPGFCYVFSTSRMYGINTFHNFQQEFWQRLSFSCNSQRRNHRNILKPLRAPDSGLEASMMDSGNISLTFKNVEIVIESQDANKIQLRVDLTGEETQKAFDVVLKNLARQAPPIPGFRRQKGGKTSKVPKNFLLEMIGEERVTKFVIQEIITSTVGNFVEKKNLVGSHNITTIQTQEQLSGLFTPGNAFGFNAVLEPDNPTAKTNNGNSEI